MSINLIQYNPVESLPYQRPTDKAAHAFLHALRDCGVNTHLRQSRGLDIEGACGQLRRRMEEPVQTAARHRPSDRESQI